MIRLFFVLVAACALNSQAWAQEAGDARRLRELNARVVRTPAILLHVDQAGTAPATATATTTAPQTLNTLRAGDLAHVQLGAADESAFSRVVVARATRSGLNASQVVTLPDVIRAPTDQGDSALMPYVLITQNLRRQPGARDFVGKIKVGVAPASMSMTAQTLATPILFQVLNDGIADPDRVTLNQTTPPYLSEITIRVPAIDRGVTLRVASPFNPRGAEVPMPADAALDVRTDSAEIEGFGLETADVNVAVIGVQNPEGLVVTLNATPAAYFSRSNLPLDAHGHATTQIRSRNIGSVTITASTDTLADAPTTIYFRFPWATIIACLFDCLIGGGIRWQTAAPADRKPALLLASLLTGSLAFALYAVGANLFGAAFPVTVGSVLVVAVSGLAAYIGPSIFPKPLASP